MKKSFEVTSETTVFLTVENIDDIMITLLLFFPPDYLYFISSVF